MTPETFGALLREEFYFFVMKSYAELHPGKPFISGPHLELMAARLFDCFNGKTKRLIINVPPRSLKSVMISQAFPAYILGRRPRAQVLCVSYGQELAESLSRGTRRIMTSPWYLRAFPTRLSSSRQPAHALETVEGGGRRATSNGGVVTGFGADFILIDDPLKPVEAISKTLRTQTNDYFSHTLLSRLNDKATGCIIVIMQRLHEDDLAGYLKAQGGWEVLSLPAIAEQDESFDYTVLGRKRRFRRVAGQALHPEREPREVLEGIRREIGEYDFAGQYQQRPAPQGGGLIKEEWLRYYDDHQKPPFEYVFQSWDTANKPSELADFSVCTTWGVHQKSLYLLHVERSKVDFPALKAAVRSQRAAYGARNVLIEDKSSGTSLIQDLRHEGMHSIEAIKPEGDKLMRMHSQSDLFSGGFVYLPREEGWLDAYRQELLTFPACKYDDQVDSTSQALGWFKEQSRTPYAIQYMRMLAEQQGIRLPPTK